MGRTFRVASVQELPPGSAKEVCAAGHIIALFNVEGTIHALDGVCPHQGGPLGQGELNGQVITCPWHGWQFDVTTGRHQLNPQICQQHWHVQIQQGDVLLVLDETD